MTLVDEYFFCLSFAASLLIFEGNSDFFRKKYKKNTFFLKQQTNPTVFFLVSWPLYIF